MDNEPGQEVPSGPLSQQDDPQDSENQMLVAIVQQLSPQERIELNMLLQTAMQKDRQSGDLSMDDFNEKGSLTPMESGEVDHMTELGR